MHIHAECFTTNHESSPRLLQTDRPVEACEACTRSMAERDVVLCTGPLMAF